MSEFDYGILPTLSNDSQIAVDYDYGYDGALFVGYDLGSFRIEAEVAYKRARIDAIQSIIALPGQGGAGTVVSPLDLDAGGGHTSALSFMINGMLDFGDDDGISGFVGAGVGLARINHNNLRAFENQGAFLDDSDRALPGSSLRASVRRLPTIST